MAKKAKEVKEKFIPEVVEEGVTRTEEKMNPADALASQEIVRKPGNWIKATMTEVADFEAKGVLIGFDSAKMEVLIKEA